MTADERRRAIWEAIRVRRHDKIQNLAFEFGVSRRTIEYDVERLSLHYPVYTTKRTGGGVHVEDWYKPEWKTTSSAPTEKTGENLSSRTPSAAGTRANTWDR